MLMNLLPFKTLRMNSKRNILLRTDTSKKLARHFAVHAQIKSLKPLKDTFSTDEAADKPENCKLRRRNRKVDKQKGKYDV